MQNNAYTSHDIRQWERFWFDDGNSSFGLMQQAALLMTAHIHTLITPNSRINVWCGMGNNGGDGLLIAKYLHDDGHYVRVILPNLPTTDDAKRAHDSMAHLSIITDIQSIPSADVQIDALFGIGLDRPLDDSHQQIIKQFNTQNGMKIAIDLPSGLHADTGVALPICIKADHTLCLIGHKLGLYGAVAKSAVGKITITPLIPPHEDILPTAHLVKSPPRLPSRDTNAHKGDFGSVMVIGGHAKMGGAVIMSGESAMAVGAGRVTVLTHANHHTAILSRSPNLMLGDIDDERELDKLSQMTAVCFGMGLGRDDWAKATFERIFDGLWQNMANKTVVLDADALWHLANRPTQLPSNWIITPHSAEAARLLGVSAADIERDRFTAIRALCDTYGAMCVLKGANSLTLSKHTPIKICTLGNAGMATSGMGDVLSGMMAGLAAQTHSDAFDPTTAVALHAHAGDILAEDGTHSLFAHDMPHAIKQAMNT